MTKKQKIRRNSFDANSNTKEDDFILADLDAKLNEEEPSPVPLNNFLDDEETIDTLLINPGFDATDELDEDVRSSVTLVNDDLDLADDFSPFDQFVFKPIEEMDQNLLSETEAISASNLDSRADFDAIQEEDAIDRLLVDAGFDANDEQEQGDKKPEALEIDDINLADEGGVYFGEQDVMAVDAGVFTSDEKELTLDKEKKNTFFVKEKNTESVKQAISETTSPDKDLDSLNNDVGIAILSSVKDEQESIKKQVTDFFKEQNARSAVKGTYDSGVKAENPETSKQEQAFSDTALPDKAFESVNIDAVITTLSSVRLEQEAIKKQINDYENKVKKDAIITYISLSIGIVALLSTLVMGAIVSSAQTKLSKLTDMVSIIEEDLTISAGKNADMEIDNSDSSIGQLNQKVTGIPEQSAGKKRISSSMLASGIKATETKEAAINKSSDNPQINLSMLENKKPSEATVNQVSAEKKVRVQNQLRKQSLSSVDLSRNKITTAAAEPTNVNKSNDKLQAKTPALEKKKTSEAEIKKASAENKTNNNQTSTVWSVILTAYEDKSYAERKAAKFKQKGIPVKVIAVKMNDKTWYRLKVGGFKNKEKATSYADKIKKSLNLNTVSVSNN